MEGSAHENVLERQCLALQIQTEPRFVSGFRKSVEDGDHISRFLPVSQPITQPPLNDRKLELVNVLSLAWNARAATKPSVHVPQPMPKPKKRTPVPHRTRETVANQGFVLRTVKTRRAGKQAHPTLAAK